MTEGFMTDKSKSYNLTDEHFERERAELNKIRSKIVAEQEYALEEFDRKFDRLTQLQAEVAYLAERYAKPERKKSADARKTKSEKPKRPTPSRPVPSGKRWTAEEEARLLSGDDDQLKQMAAERGVKWSAITHRRSSLRNQRQEARDAADEADNQMTNRRSHRVMPPALAPERPLYPDQPGYASNQTTNSRRAAEAGETLPEASSSKTPEIVEAISAPDMDPAAVFDSLRHPLRPQEFAEDEGERRRTPLVKPGRVVEGLIDSGPGRGRTLDPEAFASRRSD
jgi:hypothetical protein